MAVGMSKAAPSGLVRQETGSGMRNSVCGVAWCVYM